MNQSKLKPLVFRSGNTLRPTYILDSLGQLALCDDNGVADTQIPFATRIIKANTVLGSDLNAFNVTHLNQLISLHCENGVFHNAAITSAYPKGVVTSCQEFFCENIDHKPSEVAQAIAAFERFEKEDNYSSSSKIEAALNGSGVFRIPYSNIIIEKYHTAILNSNYPPGLILEDGWYSARSVYKKAIVT